MKITFIRHAQTKYNAKKLFQGQMDIELSKEGLDATIEKANSEKFDFDLCLCSPLLRTRKTAEILFPNVEKIYDDRIIENCLGEWEGTPYTEEKSKLLKNNYVPKNAESHKDIDFRVNSFLNDVKEKYSDKNIIVVTHVGVILSVCRILGLEGKVAGNLETVTVEI